MIQKQSGNWKRWLHNDQLCNSNQKQVFGTGVVFTQVLIQLTMTKRVVDTMSWSSIHLLSIHPCRSFPAALWLWNLLLAAASHSATRELTIGHVAQSAHTLRVLLPPESFTSWFAIYLLDLSYYLILVVIISSSLATSNYIIVPRGNFFNCNVFFEMEASHSARASFKTSLAGMSGFSRFIRFWASCTTSQ